MNNYLYLLSITAWVKPIPIWIKSETIYNDRYDFIRNNEGFYESLEEAIECGILYINENVFYEIARGDEEKIPLIIKLFENDDHYGYNFNITKICCNHLKFDSEDDMYKYYKDNINNISKEDLYDFLMKIAKIEHLKYSYSGRLIDAELGDLDINTCSSRAFDEENYHCNKFKKGDLVKIKEFGDDIYYIYEVENSDKSIYDSENPLEFTKGYYLGIPDNIEPINDYEAYRFMDEDLESIN